MEIIGLGAVIGLVMTAACMMFYRKGVRDCMEIKRGTSQKGPGCSPRHNTAHDDAGMAAMMKRYEAILSYDPYGAPQKSEQPGASYKEGV